MALRVGHVLFAISLVSLALWAVMFELIRLFLYANPETNITLLGLLAFFLGVGLYVRRQPA